MTQKRMLRVEVGACRLAIQASSAVKKLEERGVFEPFKDHKSYANFSREVGFELGWLVISFD